MNIMGASQSVITVDEFSNRVLGTVVGVLSPQLDARCIFKPNDKITDGDTHALPLVIDRTDLNLTDLYSQYYNGVGQANIIKYLENNVLDTEEHINTFMNLLFTRLSRAQTNNERVPQQMQQQQQSQHQHLEHSRRMQHQPQQHHEHSQRQHVEHQPQQQHVEHQPQQQHGHSQRQHVEHQQYQQEHQSQHVEQQYQEQHQHQQQHNESLSRNPPRPRGQQRLQRRMREMADAIDHLSHQPADGSLGDAPETLEAEENISLVL